MAARPLQLQLFTAAIALTLTLTAAGCNCGKTNLNTTQSSLSVDQDVIDFGIVPEGTSKGAKLRLSNEGRAARTAQLSIALDGGADFTVASSSVTIEGGGFSEVLVTFAPAGAGEDTALLTVTADDETALVTLHGGPILPSLSFVPDPLSFAPATSPLVTKTATLKSTGSAALSIQAVGVNASGNPDFAVTPPSSLPATLMPGETLSVQVSYARSARTTKGYLDVRSTDADAGVRQLELIPDGTNSAECVENAVQPCPYDGGFCGTRTCVNGTWSSCSGCDAGVPNNSNCSANGTFTVDGGAIQYTCCFGLSTINISSFQISANGSTFSPKPNQPGSTLNASTAASCPSGTFTATRILSGSCTETYELTGTFTSDNTFEGTYSATYSGGSSCNCFGLDTPCSNQSWPVTAYR